MRVTLGAKSLRIQKSAGHRISISYEIKNTNNVNETHATGTWTDVTAYISKEPSLSDKLESKLFQPQISSITIHAFDISYWETNFFGSAVSETYREIKIKKWIDDETSDKVTVFAGWIDRKSVQYNEFGDTLKFKAENYLSLARDTKATRLAKRYLVDDAGGGGNEGISFKDVTGVWVTAGDTTYNNTVQDFTYTKSNADFSNNETITFDDETVDISAGGSFANIGTQASPNGIDIYVSASSLPADDQSEKIYFDGSGNAYTYPFDEWAFELLRMCFDEIGIETLEVDSFEIETHDSSEITSQYGVWRDDSDVTLSTPVRASVLKSNKVYTCSGSNLYSFDLQTNATTDHGSVGTITTLEKIFNDTTTNFIWIIWIDSGTYKCRGFNVSTASFASSTLSLSANLIVNSLVLFEARAQILYCRGSTDQEIRAIDISSPNSLSEAVAHSTSADLVGGAYYESDTEYLFHAKNGANYDIKRITYSGGSWGSETNRLTAHSTYYEGGATVDESGTTYLYAEDTLGGVDRFNVTSGGTPTSVIATGVGREDFLAVGSAVYATEGDSNDGSNLKKYSGGSATNHVTDALGTKRSLMNDATYGFVGVSFADRKIWRIDNMFNMYVEKTDLDGMSIYDVIKKLAIAFNLLIKVRADKTGLIYRRADDNGDIVGTGDTFTMDQDYTSSIEENRSYKHRFDVVKITGAGDTTHSYDGTTSPTTFDIAPTVNDRVLHITNDWINSGIVKSLAFRFYQFFSKEWRLYDIRDIQYSVQYEALDKANIGDFSTLQLGITGTGLIISQQIKNEIINYQVLDTA